MGQHAKLPPRFDVIWAETPSLVDKKTRYRFVEGNLQIWICELSDYQKRQ